MSGTGQHYSDLVEIARRNGDFRKNWGILIGAFLYLRSLGALRPRPPGWTGLVLGLLALSLPWAARLARLWP